MMSGYEENHCWQWNTVHVSQRTLGVAANGEAGTIFVIRRDIEFYNDAATKVSIKSSPQQQ